MKNLVKNILGIMLIMLVAFSFISCEGPEGIPGNNGEDGNANVTLYLFDGNDFSTTANIYLYINGITESEYDNSAWLVYLTRASGLNYPIPGFGLDASSYYRTYFFWDGFYEDIEIAVKRLEGAGEDYAKIKVIQIVASDVVDNIPLSLVNAVDVTNYQAVLDYYGLEEE